MGNFLSLPILVVAAALQAGALQTIRLLGGSPDLVFLLVVSWSINSDLDEAVIWAFVGGITLDLLSYNPTGTSVMGLLAMVFAVSGLGQQVYRVGFVILVGLVLTGTILQDVISMVILALIGHPIDWLTSLTFVTAPTAFYNLIFIWPIYWFVRRIQRRIERQAPANR